jgi:putative oxidoreductase
VERSLRFGLLRLAPGELELVLEVPWAPRTGTPFRRRQEEDIVDVGRFLIRLLIGGFFIGHGTQKLLGWFGGGGPEQTGQMFESVGLRPGRRMAVAAGATEVTGGTLIAAGLATPFAAASLIGVMLTAIKSVHWSKGPWVTSGGYEYNAVLVAVLFTLAERGPGWISLDRALGTERCGTRWALFALGAGATGAALVDAAARRAEARPQRVAAEASAGQQAPEPAPAAV